MASHTRCSLTSILALLLVTTGCASPYHADRGALFGGLGGAGLGAIVGNQLGSTGAGAAIGAAAGALTGAAVGGTLDDMEARNRAMIASQLGREVAPGAVTTQDVIAMSQAGINQELIINHIRGNGLAAPLQTSDLIFLQEQGVSTPVIAAMQTLPPPAPVVVTDAAVQPVIYEEHYFAAPYPLPPRHCYYPRSVGFGVTVTSDNF